MVCEYAGILVGMTVCGVGGLTLAGCHIPFPH